MGDCTSVIEDTGPNGIMSLIHDLSIGQACPSSTFPNFAALPVELRREIWSHCLPPARLLSLSRDVTVDHMRSRCPEIAHVNREARAVAMENGFFAAVPNPKDSAPARFWVGTRTDIALCPRIDDLQGLAADRETRWAEEVRVNDTISPRPYPDHGFGGESQVITWGPIAVASCRMPIALPWSLQMPTSLGDEEVELLGELLSEQSCLAIGWLVVNPFQSKVAGTSTPVLEYGSMLVRLSDREKLGSIVALWDAGSLHINPAWDKDPDLSGPWLRRFMAGREAEDDDGSVIEQRLSIFRDRFSTLLDPDGEYLHRPSSDISSDITDISDQMGISRAGLVRRIHSLEPVIVFVVQNQVSSQTAASSPPCCARQQPPTSTNNGDDVQSTIMAKWAVQLLGANSCAMDTYCSRSTWLENVC